jgi:hypothetical protein
MNTWFRKVGMGALALTLAGVLGGCNNGDGGGGGFIRLFFGINGQGNCTEVIVDVNLEDADAILSRDEFGDPQCTINAVLDNAGCDITITEFENGDLRAIISGCTIPAVVNLFSCLFEDVDISELVETATAQCECVNPGCDENPPVCISLDPDPRSCEDCNNNIDDDDDGLEDCDDPDCRNAPECTGTSTTSTSSTTVTVEDTTTTTNTTSTTVTTSTTLPGDEFNCTLIFRLADDVTLGALQWDFDYGNASGFLLGQGAQVECDSLVEGVISAFNDCDTVSCPDFATKEEVLDSGFISLDGFSGPTNLSECTFVAQGVAPVAGDFTITVTEAAEPDLDPIVPLPDVVLFDIECDVTTTTMGPTTTTTGGPVTTTTGGPVTTTTTTLGGDNYNVTFSLDSASASVGALQWSTDYSTAPGGFQGKGATVSCTNLVPQSLFAPNDKDLVCSGMQTKVCTTNADCTGVGECTVELEELTLGIISLDSFAAPIDLVRCTFNGSAGDPPVAGDFTIDIEDATDAAGDPITAEISVEVSPVP